MTENHPGFDLKPPAATVGQRKTRIERHHAAAARALAAILAFFPVLTAHAAAYQLTSGRDEVVGDDEAIAAAYEDTLYDLARKYGIGTEELIRGNPGVDPWLPGAGKQIVIPGRRILPSGAREGIVVNLPEHRLYYYPRRKRGAPIVVITYPVGIGKMDWRTPLGLTHVSQKEKNPVWTPPASIRREHALAGDPLPARVPSGPLNPLGLYALRLAVGDGTYLIHGTNNPIAVGMPVTHGCVRMYPDDIAALFEMIAVGTPVGPGNLHGFIDEADGRLLLEAHPPVDAQGQSTEPDLEQFASLLRAAVGDNSLAVNWDYAREVLQRANGVIATVGLEATPPAP